MATRVAYCWAMSIAITDEHRSLTETVADFLQIAAENRAHQAFTNAERVRAAIRGAQSQLLGVAVLPPPGAGGFRRGAINRTDLSMSEMRVLLKQEKPHRGRFRAGPTPRSRRLAGVSTAPGARGGSPV